ncbi:flagellar protein FlgN [Halalkalibacillus sediminis]|uniref:Flagellar protein FlgN n=1 Tax=Halalkalibacillus sediminis TaxID=2018042 RepID=A0A2I0QUF4_9BACI|nr:flagellar protein FlgN [Halalkalibacillus sediminis]PKR77982.1 flagellar protein FlgN [Halalkalibacillus sediminis]
MSVQAIIEKLEKIYQLHESLLKLSKEKTEQIKLNEIESFNQILMTERKHVQAIEQLEAKRVEETQAWFQQNAPDVREQTINSLIGQLEDSDEKNKLEKLYGDFIILLADLKQQEKLNHDLTQQSLQFVQLSLEMIQPKYQSDLNYKKPTKSQGQRGNTSAFDSRA